MEPSSRKEKKLSSLEVAQANVRQLQKELNIPKMKTSEAAKDLQTYIEAHQGDDYLVKGFEQSPKKNPFRKKKYSKCMLF